LLLLLLATGLVLFVIPGNTPRRDDAKNNPERALADQLELFDLNVKLEDTYAAISGRIRNVSSTTVSTVTLRLRVYDCKKSGERKGRDETSSKAEPKCETIAEEPVLVLLRVPPQQTRYFEERSFIGKTPTVGERRWSIACTDASE
jgi:hypothetical protein